MTSPDYSHHFSINNIPFGIASSKSHADLQAATRIENRVIFLNDLAKAGAFSTLEGLPDGVFAESTLNSFAALDRSIVNGVRTAVQEAYKVDNLPPGSTEDLSSVTLHMPVYVGDFTDFSCSLNHVKNAGRIVINNETPPPGFYYFPTCYGGRGGSVVVSGTPIERPMGQYYDKNAQIQAGQPRQVVFGASKDMDYELELAAVVGKPLPLRRRLMAVDADEHIFGFVVLNDWSARDIQILEMMPLGPTNSKNVGTTISPWIVTLDALEPFRVNGPPKAMPVVSYLDDPSNSTYDINMSVEVLSDGQATTLGKCEVKTMYWNARQMFAHIVSAGSALRTGDLMATGTVSGPTDGTHGCLLEATRGGREEVQLKDGSKRTYLQDGDVVRMTAVCGGEDSGVGFGECIGELTPARPFS